MRGQALPCMEGATRLSRKIFPKKKKTLGAIWGIPLQQQLQFPLYPTILRGIVRTSSRRELRLQAPTGGGYPETRECTHEPGSAPTSSQRKLRLQAPPGAGCPATGSVPSYWAVCPSTREYPHLISEEAETAGTTQGRVPSDRECAHTPGSVCTSSWRKLRPQAHGRVRIKEGSACTPIAQRRPTIKKSG